MRREFRAHLRETVLARQHWSVYEEARAHEPVLAAHTSIVSVLATLAGGGEAQYVERDALALALIRAQQRAPSALWTSALLIAFAPMLLRLRGRIAGNLGLREELDLLVVERFLEVVQEYPAHRRPGHTALLMRQETQRAVFQLLNRERARAEADTPFEVDLMDLRALGDLVASEVDPEAEEEDRHEMRLLLRERAALAVPSERLELIEATCFWGETIVAYATRRHPGLEGPARAALYERLKRERQRTVAKLRPLFRPAPDDDREGAAEPPASTRLRCARPAGGGAASAAAGT